MGLGDDGGGGEHVRKANGHGRDDGGMVVVGDVAVVEVVVVEVVVKQR